MKKHHLSQAQMEIYYASVSHPETTAYNLPQVLPFSTAADLERMKRALEMIWTGRKELHTRIGKTTDGEVVQWADGNMALPLRRLKMSESAVQKHITEEFIRPFDLFGSDPLVRFELIETEKHHYLLIDIHHIIADGRTLADCIVHTDLPNGYNGIAPSPAGYGLYTYADEEYARLGSPAYEEARQFFLSELQGIPFTRLSVTAESPVGKRQQASALMDREKTDRWCDSNGISPAILFAGAFAVVLSKLARTSHPAFALLTHGRTDRRLRQAYGMFVKSIAVKASCDGEKTAVSLLHELKHWLFAATRHAHYPFTHLCRDLRQTPSATFAFQGSAIEEYAVLGDERVATIQPVTGQTANDLSCIVYQDGTSYEVRTEASSALIGQTLLEGIAQAVAVCAATIIDDSEQSIASLPLIGSGERDRLLKMGKGEPLDYDESQTFVSLFLRQAAANPMKTAVSDGSRSLTYQELANQSARIADKLRKQGIGAGDRVVVNTGQQIEFLSAVIGIERSGAAYVPINPSWPDAHKRAILTDSEAKAVCDGKCESTTNLSRTHKEPATCDVCDQSKPDGIAYIIYTSGSTGKPKGVKISHRAKLSLIKSIVHLWGIDSGSRICCHSSVAFDASVEDLFPALTTGGTVFVIPADIRHDLRKTAEFINRHHITGGCFTTQFGVQLLQRHRLRMRYLCLGGEKLTVNPKSTIPTVNTYGPTEFTVDATYHWLLPDRNYQDIPIGRPFPNQQAILTDPYGQLVPQGATGELRLAGPQLFSGYTGQPAAPSDSYPTGDLCRWNDEGELEYFGRCDRQLKIRGYRVSPEEIETAMMLSGLVGEVYVGKTGSGMNAQLIAYFTDKDISDPVSINQLKGCMAQRLPSHMIPSRFCRLACMPKNTAGKVDAGALPLQAAESSTCQPPATSEEAKWCRLFRSVLNIPEVSPEDNFFEIGGSSLLAITLQTAAGKEGMNVDYNDLYSHPTPRLLARLTSSKVKNKQKNIDILSDYDYSGINRLLTHAGSPENDDPADRLSGPILLTGANGFLGAHLLWNMLHDNTKEVVCMVRPKNGEHGAERLRQSMDYYFGSGALQNYSGQIQVIEKDILELSAADIPASVGTILHCAADIRHQSVDGCVKAVNVDGTTRLLNIAETRQARLIHISTISIAGTNGKEALTEERLYVGQTIRNAYVQSKFLAEQAVLQAVADGKVKSTVFRIGNLSPRRIDGRFRQTPAGGIHDALEGIRIMGCYPAGIAGILIDQSPVDQTAKAVIMLAKYADTHPVMHPFNPHPITLSGYFSGTAVKPIDDQLFSQHLEQAMNDATLQEKLLPLAHFLSMAADEKGMPTAISNHITMQLLNCIKKTADYE
jgi:amino acid adenylation domain-containing protein